MSEEKPNKQGTLSGAFLLAYLDVVPTCWAPWQLTAEEIAAREEEAMRIDARMREYIAGKQRGEAPPG